MHHDCRRDPKHAQHFEELCRGKPNPRGGWFVAPRSWEDTAILARFFCQYDSLQLKPWPNVLAQRRSDSGDDGSANLRDKLLKAGVGIYHPDPSQHCGRRRHAHNLRESRLSGNFAQITPKMALSWKKCHQLERKINALGPKSFRAQKLVLNLSREILMTSEQKRKALLMTSVAVVGALAATGMVVLPASDASAWQSPTKHRYLSKPLQLCDRGTFYVGGAPKLTRYGGGPQAGQAVVQKIIGSMYVQFSTPMVSKSWPLIIVHGSGYTGSCVEGTAGGNEGWADYTVRNGVPTYVVDQAGRGRSGFDQSVIHEGEALIATDTAAAAALIPTLGGSTSTAWTSWFGHIVPSWHRHHQLVRWSGMAHRHFSQMVCPRRVRIRSA